MSDYDDDLDGVTELTFVDPRRVDGVRTPASGSTFVLVKSRAAGPRLSPKTRQAFRENAQRVRRGERPKRGKAGKKAKRGRVARPAMAAKAASSSGSPAMGAGESDAILRWVTGESGATCGMPTADGSPCQRPSVGGLPCHHHI